MEMTHKSLCDLAVNWLKRPNSRGGHGCHLAVSEVCSGWSGEIPDAFGAKYSGGSSVDDGSVVVEVKVSRSDFLADKNKPHRNGQTIGLGNWRYYMCPAGLIKPEEIPEKFGLLYVNSRGHIKPIKSPFTTSDHFERCAMLEKMKYESDSDREAFITVRLFRRIGDPEKFNQDLRAAWRERAYWSEQHKKLDDENKNLKREVTLLNRKLKLIERSLKADEGISAMT